MDLQNAAVLKTQVSIPNENYPKELKLNKVYDSVCDSQMTSSILSVTSSLTSPVDSGVQLLDSESEVTSVMSMSGMTLDSNVVAENNGAVIDTVKNTVMQDYIGPSKETVTTSDCVVKDIEKETTLGIQQCVMTKSDIANQNVTPLYDPAVYSTSAPIIDFNSKVSHDSDVTQDLKDEDEEKQEQDQVISEKTEIENKEPLEDKDPLTGCEMHVSMSEEVSETIESEVAPPPPPDEQIVFRRQRKKKSPKSDTPKKRVSFHEDILNSTKIDDIHINHGFITHQPDISMSFFNWDSIRKKDVVKGRYSWAAEGDTPYYQRSVPEREVHSELYQSDNRWSGTYSSTASSSVDSFDSGSSNSLNGDSEPTNAGAAPTPRQPRSSCLKKRSNSRHIETHVVEEVQLSSSGRRSESNLLDSNIFGSLKNILSLSSSVPLAERGVPEGQEDITPDSSSKESKQQAFANSGSSWLSRSADRYNTPDRQSQNEQPSSRRNSGGSSLIVEPARSHLRLVPSETPCAPPNLPSNVVLCDSAVYEHKGISYSYEYDKFQKSFETEVKSQKPKSSTVYQLLLNDLNFFKKREKEISENNLKNICESPLPHASTPVKDNTCSSKSMSSDWSSDTTETVSDVLDSTPSKHLCSPKHKVKPNHYSVQSFKTECSDSKSDDNGNKSQNLRATSSKTSLINRFLRNVTMKKILDAKLQKKQRSASNKCMGLYMKGAVPDQQLCEDLDKELEEEIRGEQPDRPISIEMKVGSNFLIKLKKEVFRDPNERLTNIFKVRSVYSSIGETRPFAVFLTNATLYVSGFKPNYTLSNYFVLPYSELNTIMIGPNAHTIHLSSNDYQMQCFLTTGSSDITAELVGRLELAMRHSGRRPRIPLPAVRYLSMRDMQALRYDVCRQTAVDKDEEYFHYSVVAVQEINGDTLNSITPLGPTKEGPLMFRMSGNARWETGYFILKGGVLYMLSSPSNRVPMRALPLSGGGCIGAHRLGPPHSLRPHTFELLLGPLALQLAAPDEYVASDWLQALVQTASGLYSTSTAGLLGHGELVQSCTLLLTSSHLLTMRETFPGAIGNTDQSVGARCLSCAAIEDITALRIPLAEQSWCVLEFACREVHETSGDLVIYFATNTELERFLSTLEMLWSYNNINVSIVILYYITPYFTEII